MSPLAEQMMAALVAAGEIVEVTDPATGKIWYAPAEDQSSDDAQPRDAREPRRSVR